MPLKKLLILTVLIILLAGSGIYYWTTQSGNISNEQFSNSQTNEQIQKEENSLGGIFYRYERDITNPTASQVIIYSYDFLSGQKKELTNFRSFYAPRISFKNNKLAYVKALDGKNCTEGFKGQIICNNEFSVFDIVKAINSNIASNVMSFAFTPNGAGLVYTTFEKNKSQSNIYIYDIETRDKKTLLSNHPGVIEIILGSDQTKREVYFVQNDTLYQSSNGTAVLLYDPKLRVGEEVLGNYILSGDGTKVLVSQGSRFAIFKIGLFDITSQEYRDLDLDKMRLGDDNAGYYPDHFIDSNALWGTRHDGYGKYSYWEFDIPNGMRKKIFNTDNGLILAATPDRKNFLIRSSEFINNRGRVTFFIEPSQFSNRFVVEKNKSDGNEPNIYFIGWLK